MISRALHRRKVHCQKAVSSPLLNTSIYITDRLTAWKDRYFPQKALFLITQFGASGLATLTSSKLTFNNSIFCKLTKDANSTLNSEG